MINAFSLFKGGVLISEGARDEILYTGVRSSVVAADKALAIAVDANDWPTAQQAFQTCIELEPRWFLAYFRLGFILDKLGRTKDAETCYEQTIAIEPRVGTGLF